MVSLRFGCAAVWLVLAATSAERGRLITSAVILNFLDELGLVRNPAHDRISELTEPSFFVITDVLAIQLALNFGLFCAAMAMVVSLWAELKREDTLCLSVGYLLGLSAVLLYAPVLAAVAATGGAIGVTKIRRRSRDA